MKNERTPHIQRVCVFKRCPETTYVPRNSLSTPTEVLALDLNDWGGVAALQHDILKRMSYLDSSVLSISYHLMGEECGMQRPLAALYDDAVQHSPQRRSKGVMLHLKVESNEVDKEDLGEGTKNATEVESKSESVETKYQEIATIEEVGEKAIPIVTRTLEEVKEISSTPGLLTLELTFNEGELFNLETQSWDRVTPYAWSSGHSISRIDVDVNIPVAELPNIFRQEILRCASQDQPLTSHYLEDLESNAFFTSAITIDGESLSLSLDDKATGEQSLSDLRAGKHIIQASVVMSKAKTSTSTPGMILQAVRHDAN